MLGEIKFRAWDKINKTMYTDAINNCRDTFEMILKHPQIYEVMQYTGFKDKSGVEIYREDIMADGTVNYVVASYKGAWRLKRNVRGDTWWKSLYRYVNDCEVIGNIYENPELLKEAK